MNRRTFLKYGVGLSGVGLALYVTFENRYTLIEKAMNYMANKDFDANAFIFVQPDGMIRIICHRSEMGQGIRTALPMIMADELDASWEQIEIIQADGDPKYGSQNTDGSKSIRDFWIPLRTAAASAREMLKSAAAQAWNVNVDECYTLAGKVIHRPTNRRFEYGKLAARASKLEVSQHPPLKPPKDFNIIGQSKTSYDVLAFTNGQAQYGVDVEIPGMLYATLLRAPVPDATIKHIDDSKAKAVQGVKTVVQLEGQGASINTNHSIAIVGSNTWSVFKGKDLLEADWDYTDLKLESSTNFKIELRDSLKKSLKTFRDDGNSWKQKYTGTVVKSNYHTPYLVHAPMEPLVSTANVTSQGCEVWAPCQDPQRAMKDIAKVLDIEMEKIKFHVTFLGGGFGRKSQPDFVLESVLLSKEIKAPVKVQWSREDDIKHGFYHAESYQELKAQLNNHGYPERWDHKTTFPTILKTFIPIAKTPADWEIDMAASNLPYRIKNIRCSAGTVESSLRIGWFRSVCNVWHSFAVESFIDELALAGKHDPVAYRLKLLTPSRLLDPEANFPQDTGRMIKVIQTVRDKFRWDEDLPLHHGKGFASQFSFASYVATAIDVTVKENIIKVHRVVTCIDCGLAVNPESVKAQMEGAVIFGLSAALHGKITLERGRVTQSNFHDYPILRMNEAPNIEVYVVDGNKDKPTGVGEPGVPPVAPALANAIYSASQKRLRNLPLILS